MTYEQKIEDLRAFMASPGPKPMAFSGPRVFVDALAWQHALAAAGTRTVEADFAAYRPWCLFVCDDVPVRVFVGDDRTEIQLDPTGAFTNTSVRCTWIPERAPAEVILCVTELAQLVEALDR